MVDTKTVNEESLQLELVQTFSPELALAAYIPLTSIFGRYFKGYSKYLEHGIRSILIAYIEYS